MPGRQYAPVPASQGDADDADRQIEEAFDIDHEDDNQNHDNTPLLAQHNAEARTPHSSRTPAATHPTTSNGLYNFDFDFPPPPGSPPLDLAVANTWGNTNGIVVSEPVHYDPHSHGNWVGRTWRRLTGTGGRQFDPTTGRIGGGTNNDGVFANLSSRPTARITRPLAATTDGTTADDTIFHAPELASDDAPPSYAAAQADTSPPYWENTVLTNAPDDFLIDSIPAGSLMAFVWSMAISVFLEWIGFILAYMLSQTHGGRYGAKAGLGITFVRLGLWFRARGRDWSGASVPGELWMSDMMGNRTMTNATHITPLTLLHGASNFTAISTVTLNTRHHMETNSTVPGHGGPPHPKIHFADWLSLFLMTIGWFIFMSSLLGFYRVKRWEHSIRASTQPRTITPEQEQQVFTNLQIALGVSSVRTDPNTPPPPGEQDEEEELRRLEEEEGMPLTARSRGGEPRSEEEQEAIRFETRLRRDLSRLGYL